MDDGERVLVLSLGDPSVAKPILLEGMAAAVWTLLVVPMDVADLIQALNADRPVGLETDSRTVGELLSALRGAALVDTASC
ncbi:hypothetical protein [Pedococcus cremeus]|uniref:hypothetical protein n=1 Tax=Pedococcus cremeus TaxID=587636 RepID=UPI000B882404|nr:hypothetical protein [Pedococcus cremeus]